MVLCQLARITTSTCARNFSKLYKTNTILLLKYRNFSSAGVLFSERRYTEKHEWVRVDGDIGIVGISDYAQEALGDVVFAQLPEPGTKLTQSEECGALESVKAASEIFSPVSGTVTEKNANVEESPSLVNSSCYDNGWLFKVKLSEKGELDKLLTEEKYKEFLKSAV